MIAVLLFCALFMSVAGSLEEECNMLMKLDSLEARVQEQEVSLLKQDARIRQQAVSLAEKDTRIGDLEQSMAEKDTHIDDLKQSIADLERSSTEKETRIDEFEAGITELENSMAEKTTRIGEIEASLVQQATDIIELRTALNVTLNINTTVLANLEQRLRTVQAVGFTARGPMPSQRISSQMAFQTVATNEGGAFNADTGVFTCPVAGVYYFNVALLKDYSHDVAAACTINKNGGFLVRAVSWPGHTPRTGNYAAVTGVYIRLAVTDIVTLGACTTPIETSFSSPSSFTGFLVTPDD